MRFFCKVYLVGLAWVGLAGVSLAELKFDVVTKEVDALPEDTEIRIQFTFSNPTDEPIRVRDIESTCGCLKATTDRRLYGPGEEGVLDALFSLGSFVGTHQKVLYLMTEKPHLERYELKVTVNIPETVVIEPKVSKWTVGAPASEKTIDVKFVGDEPMRIVDIVSTRPQFTFRSEEVEAGRHYRILLKPATTEDSVMGALKIVTDSRTPKYQRQLAFFTVSRDRARTTGLGR